MQTNKNIQNGKGSKARHKQDDHYREEHDRIFKKKTTEVEVKDNSNNE
jgi:hypothetical protein